jgi:hypothetical protein
MTDGAWDLGVPRFGLNDVESLAEFLIQDVLGPRRNRGVPVSESE